MTLSIFAARKAKQVRNKGRSELQWFQDKTPIRQDKSATFVFVAKSAALLLVPDSTNIYVQLIDDVAGVTLASASTTEKDFAQYGGNVEAAKAVGKTLAERATAKGITECVFDRGGYVYHGRVAAVADGAREGGLKF